MPAPIRRIACGCAWSARGAWQTLFARNMFIRPKPEELADFQPDYVILHAPHFQTDPAIDGVRSGTTVALSFEQRVIVIAGTEYAGEVKKSIFTVMNWILPARACCRCIAAPISAATATSRCSSACRAPARPRCRPIRIAS